MVGVRVLGCCYSLFRLVHTNFLTGLGVYLMEDIYDELGLEGEERCEHFVIKMALHNKELIAQRNKYHYSLKMIHNCCDDLTEDEIRRIVREALE